MPVPVITVSQMRDWEKATWAAGIAERDVIGRVGEIVASRVRQLAETGGRILILAGKGHNGDDARRAAACLTDQDVHLCNVTDPRQNLAMLTLELEQRPALVVDGLFGIGLNRSLDENWQVLIQRVNESKAQVLSVDVPSGLNADTGEPQGAAIHASVTLTLGAPKKGLVLAPASPFVGRLEVAADIGLSICPFQSEINWSLARDFFHFPPMRAASAHKGDFGRLAILAGSLGFHGAGVLTSRGAQRAQTGLITLHTPQSVYHIIASQLQAVMVHPWEPALNLPGDYTGILIGPGLAQPDLPEALKQMTRLVWRDAQVPVIVDASGLDWLPHTPLSETAIRVITPHPGEAARLLRTTAADVQADRPTALRELSRRLGNCYVVLKGSQTLIGRSTGELVVNSSGNPHMAQGGSGDVLAGYLAGLLAQPALQLDPLKTIVYAVWQHGATADDLDSSSCNWIVEDLAGQIGNARPRNIPK